MILSCFVVILNFMTQVIFVGHGLWVFMPFLYSSVHFVYIFELRNAYMS